MTYDDEGRPDDVQYGKLGVFLAPEVKKNRDRQEELRETVERTKERIEDLEAETDQLRTAVAARDDRLADQADRIEHLERENDQLRERLRAVERQVGTVEQPADD